jgi:hypothetical protein
MGSNVIFYEHSDELGGSVKTVDFLMSRMIGLLSGVGIYNPKMMK